jgi:hypothetical protein
VDERRKLLRRVLQKAGTGIRLSDHLEGTDGDKVFWQACSKPGQASQSAGPTPSRSADWIKSKTRRPGRIRVIEVGRGNSPSGTCYDDALGRDLMQVSNEPACVHR